MARLIEPLPATRHEGSRFIVLEGIDGCGSTTHTKRLAKALRERGVDARMTCEPSNGPIGSTIRQILQNRLVVAGHGGARPFEWSTMALLFAADRLDHLESVILPALHAGATVVSDRYDLSSLAYQSVTAPGGESVIPWLREINALALRPDLTIVVDVSAEVAECRRAQRDGPEELFEKREVQRRLAEVYAHAEVLVPEDALVHVPGDGPVEVVAARILEAALSGMS